MLELADKLIIDLNGILGHSIERSSYILDYNHHISFMNNTHRFSAPAQNQYPACSGSRCNPYTILDQKLIPMISTGNMLVIGNIIARPLPI
jgi:hypothetical protein